ncbi:Aste57867_10432 [Aphanomyces stellatus]|uniref:Aste57867_10432 protein n=2 Tax=Aphanomyces stellatus TaxID=120398 RepID=A0A485KQU8_9STRA|nr:hypothetical protein As57867_010392 [Aphanomyces stellatus]VFT87306.1 Aste57867_10432 [Aphanomyces stellatus]
MSWRNAASVAVGTLFLFTVGSAYSISAWNSQLRDMLHLTQADISVVGACFTFGQYNSIWTGVFLDALGVRWTAAAAAVLLSGGYWTVASLSPGVAPWIVATCFVFVGFAHSFPAIAGMAANEGLYGTRHRGKILGLLVGSYCGGGAVFAYIYRLWFDHAVSRYFGMLALMFLVVCLLGVVLLKPLPPHARPNKSELPEHAPLLPPDTLLPSEPNVTLLALLRLSTFWFLFAPVLVGIGSAMFVMNNISFIVESASSSVEQVATDQIAFLVSLFSICNLVGRFAMGILSDHFFVSIPRRSFLAASVLAVGLAQLLFLVVPPSLIAVPILATGFSEGCIYALFPVMTRELFGPRHFGKNYGLVSLAVAVGFPLLLSPLSTYIYHLHATPDGSCHGKLCFGPTFAIAAALSLVGAYCSCKLP